MYVSGPPPAPAAGDRPLWLTAARRRVFEGSCAAARDPMLRVYLSDMVAAYPAALREDLLSAGRGQSYGEMAGALIAELAGAGGPLTAATPVDLVVHAFAVPDVVPGRSTAAHLSHLCPGDPMAFAVCDQGAAAAFTGLRLIREYARTGGCRQALLVITEQADLHTTLPAPAPVPARHAAVALLCGGAGPGKLEAVGQRAGVSPGEAWEIVAAELASLAAYGPVTLICGNGLGPPAGVAGGTAAGDGTAAPGGVTAASGDVTGAFGDVTAGPGGVTVAAAPGGQPATGAWWRLAGELPRLRAGRLLLADYDPVLGYLCTAAVAAGPVPAAGAGPVLGTHTPRDGEEVSGHVSWPSLPADHGTLSR